MNADSVSVAFASLESQSLSEIVGKSFKGHALAWRMAVSKPVEIKYRALPRIERHLDTHNR